MISSKVTTCTSQPVAFTGLLNTHRHLTGLNNKPQKSRMVNFWQWRVLAISQFIDGAIDWQLKPFCTIVYVTGRQMWSHIAIYIQLQQNLPETSKKHLFMECSAYIMQLYSVPSSDIVHYRQFPLFLYIPSNFWLWRNCSQVIAKDTKLSLAPPRMV